jgi:hypothetical protein
MNKTEMEYNRSEYNAWMERAKLAEGQVLYVKAIEAAMRAWQHIDGMIQFEKKYGLYRERDEPFGKIAAIELVLDLAPLLLHFEALNALENLLRQCPRLARKGSASLVDKLASARERMWLNHRLWDHLDRNPDARQDELRSALGGDQDNWRSLAGEWEAMGLIRRRPEGGTYRLTLSTRMGEQVRAKCPSCGNVAEGSKAMFLEMVPCTKCCAKALFVILPTGGEAIGRTGS